MHRVSVGSDNFLYCVYCHFVGWDSLVGIATRYGLDGPGIESRWGRDFPHPSRLALGPTQPPGYRVSPGVKRLRCGADHPPLPKRRGHERVELYLYLLSGPQLPDIGRTLSLTLPLYCHFKMYED